MGMPPRKGAAASVGGACLTAGGSDAIAYSAHARVSSLRGVHKPGTPAGQGVLTAVSYGQRVNTKGGVAPKAKCSSDNDEEKTEVDYQADYIFWKTN